MHTVQFYLFVFINFKFFKKMYYFSYNKGGNALLLGEIFILGGNFGFFMNKNKPLGSIHKI